MTKCSSAVVIGKAKHTLRVVAGGLAMLLGLVVAAPAQAACQGDSLVGTIRDGIQQAWEAVAGGDSYHSVLCPEVMGAYPKVAALAPSPQPVSAMPVAEPVLDLQGDTDGDGISDARDWCQTTVGGVRVDERGCDLMPAQVVQLPARQFAPGEDTLKPKLQNALSELADKLLATPGRERLTIVGHADAQGTDSFNDDLSLRRAWGVADFLSSKGIALTDISYQGKGESVPLADNRRKSGRAMNRRVEIVIN